MTVHHDDSYCRAPASLRFQVRHVWKIMSILGIAFLVAAHYGWLGGGAAIFAPSFLFAANAAAYVIIGLRAGYPKFATGWAVAGLFVTLMWLWLACFELS